MAMANRRPLLYTVPPMNFSFASQDATRAKADVIIVPVFESELTDKKGPSEPLATLNKRLRGLLADVAAQEGFRGKADQTFVFHTHGKLPSTRVVLVGVGARARATTESLRLAIGRGVKAAARVKAKSALVTLLADRPLDEDLRAVVEGAALGAYRFDRYRTGGKDEKSNGVDRVQVVLPKNVKKDRHLTQMLDLGRRVADATNWARDLVNEPAGVMTPSKLAEEATAAAKQVGLEVQVLGRKEIEKLKMGMFLAVTQGSAEEPKLIHLRYVPKDAAAAKRAPLVLVGKAITFDSGGLSLKTAEGMVDMKTDMAGSAAVLGAMRVIGTLAPPFPVHALMGACENMPSGTAYRPGDVLVSRLGKTVEITNTDAEGRLVLGDILTYANELKPAAIVDLATLTGACMIALGHYVVGAFGDNDAFMAEVLEAAKRAGEELWRLPIHDLQKDALRSDVADMKNSGERWGGAINAAVFLKEFVGKTPWVHLDIAGPSQSPKERGYYAKGATGVGVRTLVELVRHGGLSP